MSSSYIRFFFKDVWEIIKELRKRQVDQLDKIFEQLPLHWDWIRLAACEKTLRLVYEYFPWSPLRENQADHYWLIRHSRLGSFLPAPTAALQHPQTDTRATALHWEGRSWRASLPTARSQSAAEAQGRGMSSCWHMETHSRAAHSSRYCNNYETQNA